MPWCRRRWPPSEKAYAEISNPVGKFVDRNLYIVVHGLDGVELAHGANASRVGINQIEDEDPDGKAFVKERVDLAKQQPSFWQSYKFMNPMTKKVEPSKCIASGWTRLRSAAESINRRSSGSHDATTHVFFACGAGRADRGRGLHRFGAGRCDQYRRRSNPRAGLQMRLAAKR